MFDVKASKIKSCIDTQNGFNDIVSTTKLNRTIRWKEIAEIEEKKATIAANRIYESTNIEYSKLSSTGKQPQAQKYSLDNFDENP